MIERLSKSDSTGGAAQLWSVTGSSKMFVAKCLKSNEIPFPMKKMYVVTDSLPKIYKHESLFDS